MSFTGPWQQRRFRWQPHRIRGRERVLQLGLRLFPEVPFGWIPGGEVQGKPRDIMSARPGRHPISPHHGEHSIAHSICVAGGSGG